MFSENAEGMFFTFAVESKRVHFKMFVFWVVDFYYMLVILNLKYKCIVQVCRFFKYANRLLLKLVIPFYNNLCMLQSTLDSHLEHTFVSFKVTLLPI
jgi:hypothetical protein